MYSVIAHLADRIVAQGLLLMRSFLRVAKKLSSAALSQAFSFATHAADDSRCPKYSLDTHGSHTGYHGQNGATIEELAIGRLEPF